MPRAPAAGRAGRPQAGDRRTHPVGRRTGLGGSSVNDHRRIGAQLTHADDEETAERLVTALRDLAAHSAELGNAPAVFVPPPTDLRLEQVRLPRDAYFDRHTEVPAVEAPGRIDAEMITPYPPGIPVALPGERLTKPVLEYLTTGVRAGMFLPDAADRNLDTVRVVAEDTDR